MFRCPTYTHSARFPIFIPSLLRVHLNFIHNFKIIITKQGKKKINKESRAMSVRDFFFFFSDKILFFFYPLANKIIYIKIFF